MAIFTYSPVKFYIAFCLYECILFWMSVLLGVNTKKSTDIRKYNHLNILIWVQFLFSAFILGMPILVSGPLSLLHIGGFAIGDALIVVGLTGDMGTGKKTVSKMLKSKHGYHIIDADEVEITLRKKDPAY